MSIVSPTKEATRAILDAAWEKQFTDAVASLSKIDWEVLAHAALPNRKHGAFDIIGGLSPRQRPTRQAAISRLMTLGFLRNVPSRGFATIDNEGKRALDQRARGIAFDKAIVIHAQGVSASIKTIKAETKQRMAQLTKRQKGT